MRSFCLAAFISLIFCVDVAYTDSPPQYPEPANFNWVDEWNRLYKGEALPTGSAMTQLDAGPEKKMGVNLWGPGHVLDCDFKFKDRNAIVTPSIDNLTSPLGPISNVISLSMSQYMNSPVYGFEVRFTGIVPPPPSRPLPGAPMKIALFKQSTWYIAATADVVITTSYMGQQISTAIRVDGTNLPNLTILTQLDSERPYQLIDWDLPST